MGMFSYGGGWWFKFKMACEDIGGYVLDFTSYLIGVIVIVITICIVAGVLLSPFAVLKYLFF